MDDIELVQVVRLVTYPSKVVVHLQYGEIVQSSSGFTYSFDSGISVIRPRSHVEVTHVAALD
jgi:hypothetical protein